MLRLILRTGMRLAPHFIGALGNGKAQEYNKDDNDAAAQFLGSIIKHGLRLTPHLLGA